MKRGKHLVLSDKVCSIQHISIYLTCCAVIASRGRPQAGSQNQNGDDHPGPSTAGASLFDEKQRTGKGGKNGAQKGGKLTLAQLKELEAEKERETVVLHTRVKQLWPLMLAGDPAAENEWMVVADSLIDPFERTRALFLTTKVRPLCMGISLVRYTDL